MAETTRFAPSPTGLLHVGHGYSAWFAADAAGIGGRALLRIEDIDRTRSRPEFEAALLEDLAWLGLTWDGAARRQSEHAGYHQELVDALVEGGVAFPCFQTRKAIAAQIDADLNAPHGPDGPVFFSPDKDLPPAVAERRIAAGEAYSVRLDARKAARLTGELTFVDLDLGEVPVNPLAGGDIVLARKDAPVAYHLAVVADDAAQGVTLVTRGEDLRPACHVQRVLQALLGLPEPRYRHHRLITNAEGKRFAKRDQSVTIRAWRETGRTPVSLLDAARKTAAGDGVWRHA